MIHTSPFPTAAAVADYFNAPANATLRLVGVVPDARTAGVTAMYEALPDLEEKRRELLEERVLALISLDDDKKRSANFPKGVIEDGISVPLAIASNRLVQLAAFKTLDNAARAAWVRANVSAIGCVLIPADAARARYGCNADLLRLEE